MNWRAIFLAVCALLAGISVAQQGGTALTQKDKTPGRSVEQRVTVLAKTLHLSTAQKKKAALYTEECFASLRELAKKPEIKGAARTKRIEAINAELNRKIRSILMPDQKKKWDKMQADAAAKKAKTNSTRPK